jgi:hypothetical protein
MRLQVWVVFSLATDRWRWRRKFSSAFDIPRQHGDGYISAVPTDATKLLCFPSADGRRWRTKSPLLGVENATHLSL